MESILLSALVFSPLVGILVLAFMPNTEERLLKTVGLLATLLPLAFAIITYVGFTPGNVNIQFVEQYRWIDFQIKGLPNGGDFTINYDLGVNGLTVVLLLLTAIVSTLAAAASVWIKEHWKGYFMLFLLLEIGMLGVFASQNLLLFFIFFEITLIPTFFLIGKWGYIDKEKAAYSFLVYNGLGSAILLIVFIILYMKTGTMNYTGLSSFLHQPPEVLEQMYIGDEFRFGLLIALLVALGVKLPIVPLHTWMLKVHVQAPPSIVMIHSGILLKIGAYGVYQFGIGFFPEEFRQIAFWIALLGVINLLYGAFIAFVQVDFKRVLAYSSVSHMGIVLIGLASLNGAGMQGAMFQVVSHGLISALLFFLVGLIYERTGTSLITHLGGMAKVMPITAGFLLVGGLASLGLPGMSGFVSEFMAFLGLFKEMPVLAAVGTLGIILTAVYILRAVLGMTFGETKESLLQLKEPRFVEWLPALILTALIVLIGVYPAVLSDILQLTINAMMAGKGAVV
ncbi:complex I subunit 4 family protein [Pseudalkalibacillus decolorationis]|uniref:complex I subunit 4 family protein n=1 Tax=Pseudalkalibacillus decolorationis TaxID=163879 RepID=UPI0021487367|nr:NADH-quinone oxidoreductase subunit M [Pseudalkalibacillus decolorationis]